MATSGYYNQFPAAAVAPTNYAYPPNAAPAFGIPAAVPPMMYGAPPQSAFGVGYSNLPQAFNSNLANQPPSFGTSAGPAIYNAGSGFGVGAQTNQLQQVRDQLAALQIQRVQQPNTQINSPVAANTLANNLWQ